MVRIPTHGHPVHPGEMLLEEFLVPHGISQHKLAEVIARDHEDAPRGLRERETESHHDGSTHCAPQVEIRVGVARRGDVPCGRPEARDDEHVASLPEERDHHISAVEHWHHPIKELSARADINTP